MELQTIGQAAKANGVSIRMLRYYEEIGLIESRRKGDGAYRVYDENVLLKIRQIIVLRKLRVPVKQIVEILNNPDAAVIIDIFKQNIDELDDEITTLSIVKSMLSQFVEKLLEATQIKLALDFMSDEAVLSIIETLSFTKNHKKENFTMDDLMSASDNLAKMKEKHVRVVYIPPMTVATTYEPWNNGPDDALVARVEKFIKDVDLFKIKPDFKYYGFGDRRDGKHAYVFMMSIPDDLEVPEKFEKTIFAGGLYAAYTSHPLDFDDTDVTKNWAKNSKDYERENRHAQLEEFFNPFNAYGLRKIYDLEYATFLLPIKQLLPVPN